jgi:hypothetical protein
MLIETRSPRVGLIQSIFTKWVRSLQQNVAFKSVRGEFELFKAETVSTSSYIYNQYVEESELRRSIL